MKPKVFRHAKQTTIHPDESFECTPEALPIEALLEQLDFTPENVVDSACKQPGLFKVAIDHRMLAFRRASRSKMALEIAEADTSAHLRKEAKAIGDKITEAGLSEQVLLNKGIQELQKDRREAEEGEEFAKLLLEAFRMRRDCLRLVGELMSSELATKAYFDDSASQLRRTKEDLKKKYPGSPA